MQEEEGWDSNRAGSITGSAPDSSLASTRALSRKNRVFIFREFLMETYGDYLKTSQDRCTVLDVVTLTLSWLLVNVDGINSVVADPRVTKQIHLLRSVDYLRRHPDQVQIRSVPGLPIFQPLAALIPRLKNVESFTKPRHLRLLVNPELVEAVQAYLTTQSTARWARYWTRASNKALQYQTLGYEESLSLSVNQITDSAIALKTILETRLVIAFHPDQATEASIDLALVLAVPFCVVPCCVFPADFPHRKNPDGTRLRTYAQLLEYLRRKATNICTADLDFPFTETAKNRVLFTIPHKDGSLCHG